MYYAAINFYILHVDQRRMVKLRSSVSPLFYKLKVLYTEQSIVTSVLSPTDCTGGKILAHVQGTEYSLIEF